jgi:hypothetical protein
MPLAPSRRALKTHKETMSGIWRSLVLKPKTATWSARRTTISTPNIISDRCAGTQNGRKRLCCGDRLFTAPAVDDSIIRRVSLKKTAGIRNECPHGLLSQKWKAVNTIAKISGARRCQARQVGPIEQSLHFEPDHGLFPACSTAEIWTKRSLPLPPVGWMKPYPFVGLNHFTVPVAKSRDRRGDSADEELIYPCDAYLNRRRASEAILGNNR